MIPVFNADVRRLLFTNNIARNPEQVDYRNKAYTARFAELSFERELTLSGMTGNADNREILIALDAGDAVPEAGREVVTDSKGERWRIEAVNHDIGADCYRLTANKIN